MTKLNERLGLGREGAYTVAACFFSYFCTGMFVTMGGSILPDLRIEYGIGYQYAGLLTSVQGIAALLMSLFAGFLPYMIGSRRTMISLIFSMGLGMLLLMISGIPASVFVSYLLIGIGIGGLQINNSMVPSMCRKKETAVAVLHVTGSLGCMAAPIIVMMTKSFSWRVPATILSVTAFIGVLLFIFSRLPKERSGRTKESLTIPVSPDFWITCAITFSYIACESSLVNFAVTYIVETGLFSPGFSVGVQGIFWSMMLLGRIINAYLPEKVDRKILLLVLGSFMGICYAFFMNAESAAAVLISFALLGLSMSAIFPLNLETMPKRYGLSHVACSIYSSVGSLGGVLMPGMIGHFSERAGSMRGGLVMIAWPFVLMMLLMTVKVIRRGRDD